MVIPLRILADAQAVRYHGSTLAEFPVHAQKVFGVYWLGVQMHPNGRDLIADGRTLSHNRYGT